MPVRYLIALAGAAALMAFVMGYEKGAESVRQGGLDSLSLNLSL